MKLQEDVHSFGLRVIIVNPQGAPHNMETLGGAGKKQSVLNICSRNVPWVKGGNSRKTILFMSLIIFPEHSIYWSKAHKFSLSKFYGRHINVRASLFNSGCLISSSFHFGKWKCEMGKRKVCVIRQFTADSGSAVILFALLFYPLLSLIFQQCSLAKMLAVRLNSQYKWDAVWPFSFH